jgi:hypothetical protein
MGITQDQLDSFHRFAMERLSDGGANLSFGELFELWRIENPTADERAEIYAALDESLDDIEHGRYRPADEVLREIRAKHNLSE